MMLRPETITTLQQHLNEALSTKMRHGIIYGNKLTLSLVLLLTTCTPFATVNAPLVRARTVAVA